MMHVTGKVRVVHFIAWRNIWRNPVRSLLTIFSLSAAMALVVFYTAILEGMTEQMADYATDISTGHIQVHRQAYIDDQDIYAILPWSYLESLEQSLPWIQFSPHLYAAGLASSDAYSTGVMIKAVDFDRESKATRLLTLLSKGSLPDNGSGKTMQENSPAPVFIGKQLAKNHQISLGDELILVTQAVDGSIGNAIYQVQGIFKSFDPNFDRSGVLMSISAFQDLMYLEDGFHELLIKTNDVNDLEHAYQQVNAELERLYAQDPLDEWGGPVVVRTWREISTVMADMLEMSKSMIWILGFIILCLSSLGVMNTMMMAIHERTFEFGILLAIGMKARFIIAMILLESLYLGLLAAFFGCVLGVALVLSFGEGIDFSAYMPEGFDWAGMVFEPVFRLKLEYHYLWMLSLILLLVTFIATVIPSWKTLRLKPAEVL